MMKEPEPNYYCQECDGINPANYTQVLKERDEARAENIGQLQLIGDQIAEIERLKEIASGHHIGQCDFENQRQRELLSKYEAALKKIAAPITGNVGDKIVCLNTIDAWHAIAKDALGLRGEE